MQKVDPILRKSHRIPYYDSYKENDENFWRKNNNWRYVFGLMYFQY